MSVNIHMLKGGKVVKDLTDIPKDVHWQIQMNPQNYITLYVYDSKDKWEEDVLKLYDEDHNRDDFVAVAVGSSVRPQTTITLDYGPPAAPSRLEVLRES